MVVVDLAGGLHVGVDDDGAHELEATGAEVLGKGLGLGGLGRHVLVVPTQGLVTRELPDVVGRRNRTLSGPPGSVGRC